MCEVEQFRNVREKLAEAGIEPESSDLTMFPKNTVPLGKSDAKSMLRLIEALEELDDVHDVYANFDIPDDVLQEEASLS